MAAAAKRKADDDEKLAAQGAVGNSELDKFSMEEIQDDLNKLVERRLNILQRQKDAKQAKKDAAEELSECKKEFETIDDLMHKHMERMHELRSKK